MSLVARGLSLQFAGLCQRIPPPELANVGVSFAVSALARLQFQRSSLWRLVKYAVLLEEDRGLVLIVSKSSSR